MHAAHSKFPGVKSTPLGVHMGTGSHVYTKTFRFNTGKFTVYISPMHIYVYRRSALLVTFWRYVVSAVVSIEMSR